MHYIVKKIQSIELQVECPKCGKTSFVDVLIDEGDVDFECAHCNKNSDVDLNVLFQTVCAGVMGV